MNSFVGTYRLWRFLTAPTPPAMRKLLLARDTIRDSAGFINDVLPEPRKEGDEAQR